MVILVILLIVAVITDYLCYKIPNILIITGLILGSIYRGYITQTRGMLQAFLCIVVIFLCLFPFFLIHGLGAGDIKLFCMMAVFMTPRDTGRCIALALMIAAVFSLCKMITQKSFGRRMKYLILYMEAVILQKEYIPFQEKNEMKKNDNVIRLSMPALLSVVIHIFLLKR